MSDTMAKRAFASSYRDRMREYLRIGNIAVREAQEKSRRMGVPNVYCYHGVIYYELPDGSLSTEDPYVDPPAQ